MLPHFFRPRARGPVPPLTTPTASEAEALRVIALRVIAQEADSRERHARRLLKAKPYRGKRLLASALMREAQALRTFLTSSPD